MFAIVCVATVRSEQEDVSNPELSKELAEFEDIFSNDKASALPALKQGDYTIKIEEGKEPPYRPLYNLS